MQQSPADTSQKQLPVTVVCGTLGAGKTSVMRHLLASGGLRTAVIVNDVAEISFDLRQLKDTRNKAPLARGAEVLGGCICCTHRQGFLDTFTEISSDSNLDYILVEAAGVAEPFHIAENFALVQDVARLDTMVTVVDAIVSASLLTVLKFLSNLNEAARAKILNEAAKHQKLFKPLTRLLLEQVCFANVIILNKCDKVEGTVASEICDAFSRLNPEAQVHQCVHGRVNPASVLNTLRFSMEKAEDSEHWFAEARSRAAPKRLLPHDERGAAWWATLFSKHKGCFAGNPSAEDISKACAKNDVNERDPTGRVALMEAVQRGWASVVSGLISMRADVNIADENRVHSLHLAVLQDTEMIQILLSANAAPDCQDTDPDDDPTLTSRTFARRLEHRTPLHYACSAGNAAAVSLLVRAHAMLDVQDAQFKSPLHLAIEEQQSEIIDLLLQHQADANLGNFQSGMCCSPLMDAARRGEHELVSKLISARADINKQGKQGMAALHLATRGGHVTVTQLLIAAGADQMQQSQCGTALQLARKNAGVELVSLFGDSSGASTACGNLRSIAGLDASQRAALFLE